MNPGAMTLTFIAVAAGGVRAQDWTTLARSSARDSRPDTLPATLGAVSWVASQDELGRSIAFAGQSGVVSSGARVYALGRSAGVSRLFCFDVTSGQTIWSSPVPAFVLESWAAPTIDTNTGVVLVASAASLTALDAVSGSVRWQTNLLRSTAGATPAITSDLGPADRAFITDYDGFGGNGRLYCINIDPLGPSNAYLPGQIVWSVALGSTAANSPAYANGVVYVACVSDPTGASPGQVRAFDASATSSPQPLWTFTNVHSHGFFGGVSVAAGSVLAASYTFSGGQLSANLVKIHAATGALQWSVPCNRTDSIPVRADDGCILLSSGIRGFGSVPSVQKFRDDGASATLEWDSALHSWIDLNSNSLMDAGEYVDAGGWTIQPVIGSRAGVGPILLVGVLPAGASTTQACPALLELDLSRPPADPMFVRGSFAGAGTSPAASSGRLFTVGPAGLYALGSSACPANCDASTGLPQLTANDFQCFLDRFAAGSPAANCDASTGTPSLTANDFQCFLNLFAAGCP